MLIMKRLILYIVLFFLGAISHAQVIDSITSVKSEQFSYLIEGDSVAVKSIALNEVLILDKIKHQNKLARKKYLILKRKTRKVYPYAKLAADTLISLVNNLEDITKKRHRKKHIKKMQRFMQDRFAPELKKLTRTEGQILVKLVHRQTGITMYDLIKEYRSGFKAFVYDRTAHFFNISLKREFQPTEVYEDYLIEDVLQRSFQDGILERQPTATNVSFYSLVDIWKGYEPNYVIKKK